MGKKKSRAIVLEEGPECPSCNSIMQRRGHPPDFVPPLDTYWFTWWDYCPACRYVQHYEENKRGSQKAIEQSQQDYLKWQRS